MTLCSVSFNRSFSSFSSVTSAHLEPDHHSSNAGCWLYRLDRAQNSGPCQGQLGVHPGAPTTVPGVPFQSVRPRWMSQLVPQPPTDSAGALGRSRRSHPCRRHRLDPVGVRGGGRPWRGACQDGTPGYTRVEGDSPGLYSCAVEASW